MGQYNQKPFIGGEHTLGQGDPCAGWATLRTCPGCKGAAKNPGVPPASVLAVSLTSTTTTMKMMMMMILLARTIQ